MRSLPPFYAIGTVGMVVTAGLHMVMALVIVGPSVHSGFLALYPVFLAFLVIGGAQLRKRSGPCKA